MSDAVYELELKKCEQQGDPLGSVNRKIEVLKERGRLDRMDYEWHRWYDVLRRYFQPIPSPPQASIYMVRASASAAAVWLFILYSEAYPVTSPFVAGWVLLVVGLIQEVSLLGFSHYPDITGEDMLARMLQEVKLQEMKADKERSESAGINRQEVGDARGK